jgi:hypothetical protein
MSPARDHHGETALTLTQAAKTFGRLSGRTPHVATVHRWAIKGVRGVKLETIRLGGLRLVRPQAIEAFLANVNRGSSETATGVRAVLDPAVQSRRRAEIDAARQRLDARCKSSHVASRATGRGAGDSWPKTTLPRHKGSGGRTERRGRPT